jgi:hypothetical protein
MEEAPAPIEIQCCGVQLTCGLHTITCTKCGAHYDQTGQRIMQRYLWGGDHWTEWDSAPGTSPRAASTSASRSASAWWRRALHQTRTHT